MSDRHREAPWSCNCGRRWAGMAQAHCSSGCHAHFGSVRAFDRHRAGGQCNDPATMRTKDGKPVFKAVHNHLGTTWVQYDLRVHPAHAPAARKADAA
jgi:hypothetical protein